MFQIAHVLTDRGSRLPVPAHPDATSPVDCPDSPAPRDRLLEHLAGGGRIVAGVALVVLTVIFGWLVFGRYVLNATPTWVEQAALLLVMVITFVGAAAGVHEQSHLRVTFFLDVAPRPLRRVFAVLSHLALGIFGGLMFWYSAALVRFKWGASIPLLDLPEGLRAVPIAASGLLIALFSANHLWRHGFPGAAGRGSR